MAVDDSKEALKKNESEAAADKTTNSNFIKEALTKRDIADISAASVGAYTGGVIGAVGALLAMNSIKKKKEKNVIPENSDD